MPYFTQTYEPMFYLSAQIRVHPSSWAPGLSTGGVNLDARDINGIKLVSVMDAKSL